MIAESAAELLCQTLPGPRDRTQNEFPANTKQLCYRWTDYRSLITTYRALAAVRREPRPTRPGFI